MEPTVITSTANTLIRRVKGLAQKKNREKENCYLADGPHLVQEAVDSGADMEMILFDAEREDAFRQILAAAGEAGIRMVPVSSRVMQTLSDTVTPQGVIAVLRSGTEELPADANGLILVLDAVADPGNVGTVIRTADAVNADAVILSGGCADAYGPKTVRSTMGSLFHVPVIRTGKRAEEIIGFFRERGYLAAGTHLAGKELFSAQVPWQKKMLFVIGNEARGMSDRASEACDLLLKLPIPGKAESLNAAVAAGIFMYQWLEKTREE